jgi:predicted DNA-binding transcriptional regulator YafY
MALTFVMARDLLTPLLPPLLLRRLEPYFDAAHQVLAAAGAPGLTGWKDRVQVIPEGQPLLHAPINPDIMTVIQTALLDGTRFKGRYRPRGGDLAEYEFNPLGLVFRERIVYLVATLWDYADPRQFAMHRFKQAAPLAQAATYPDGFDLDTYIEAGAFEYPNAEPEAAAGTSLRLRMSVGAATHLHETPLSEDQVISDDPDDPSWVRVTATLRETEQLYWWLLGFGAQVEVLGPARLRERMVSNAEALLELYV